MPCFLAAPSQGEVMNGMDSYRGDYGIMSKLTLALMEDSGWCAALPALHDAQRTVTRGRPDAQRGTASSPAAASRPWSRPRALLSSAVAAASNVPGPPLL